MQVRLSNIKYLNTKAYNKSQIWQSSLQMPPDCSVQAGDGVTVVHNTATASLKCIL